MTLAAFNKDHCLKYEYMFDAIWFPKFSNITFSLFDNYKQLRKEQPSRATPHPKPANLRNTRDSYLEESIKGKTLLNSALSLLVLHSWFLLGHIIHPPCLFSYSSDPFSNQPPTRAVLCNGLSCLRLVWSLICWQPQSFALFLHTQWKHFINPPYWLIGRVH